METSRSLPLLSVIIPTLNEALHIAKTITSTQTAPGVECIVVDGGSTDGTVAIAQSLGVTVLTTAPGRAHQMNVGAQAARGELLLFLHGDTSLPPSFDGAVSRAFTSLTPEGKTPVAVAFTLHIDDPRRALRWIEWGVKVRSQWLQLPYGDQALVLRADTFWQVGGFPEQPLMEDVELVQRLRPLGKVVTLSEAVLTSPRRWQQRGILQTTLLNQRVLMGYWMGIPPRSLAQWYRGIRS